jgi:hypothetical protein
VRAIDCHWLYLLGIHLGKKIRLRYAGMTVAQGGLISEVLQQPVPAPDPWRSSFQQSAIEREAGHLLA